MSIRDRARQFCSGDRQGARIVWEGAWRHRARFEGHGQVRPVCIQFAWMNEIYTGEDWVAVWEWRGCDSATVWEDQSGRFYPSASPW